MMPELSLLQLAVAALVLLVAALAGWLLRGRRAAREKAAIGASWQQQVDAQQSANDRIAAQNTHLKEQVAELQKAGSSARSRVQVLADELAQVAQLREDLSRELSDLRRELGRCDAERRRLRATVDNRSLDTETANSRLREKDEKIGRLKLELARWQERVPPLVERFRQRDSEACQLEADLEAARRRIAALEAPPGTEDTRIEAIDEAAVDGMDASNDQYEDTLEVDAAALDAAFLRDDLKRIKGIGPTIEKTLNRLGIYRFEQIAGFGDDEVERVAAELPGFQARIRREDWIGQARLLLAGEGPDPA